MCASPVNHQRLVIRLLPCSTQKRTASAGVDTAPLEIRGAPRREERFRWPSHAAPRDAAVADGRLINSFSSFPALKYGTRLGGTITFTPLFFGLRRHAGVPLAQPEAAETAKLDLLAATQRSR